MIPSFPTFPQQRIAVFDLGSNTARLIVMRYALNDNHNPPQPYSYELLDELRFRVRLAEGLAASGSLQPEAFRRGIDAIKSSMAYCRAVGVDTIIAQATSAVRDARNGLEFLQAAAELGMDLQIMSGEEEARVGVVAIVNSLDVENGWVLDVGGGSAQLSQFEAGEFVRGSSFPLGAVRTTEQFFSQQPPSPTEVRAFRKVVRQHLSHSDLAAYLQKGSAVLVGMGGSMRNLARIQRKKDNYPLDVHHGYVFARTDLATITEDLLEKTPAERENIAGLNEDRADIIAAAAIVIEEFMDALQTDEVIISGYGLREGLFMEYFLQQCQLEKLPAVRDFTIRNLEATYYPYHAHNLHVQKLTLSIFDQLQALHNFSAWERELLAYAALIHDIGMGISFYDHHKHSFYILMSRKMPGFSHREQAIIALLARYHRKGMPNEKELEALFIDDDRDKINKLASILRLAEYLERSKAQRVKDVRCTIGATSIQMELIPAEGLAADALQVELHETQRKTELFEVAFQEKLEIIEA